MIFFTFVNSIIICTSSGLLGKVYSSCSNKYCWSTVDCVFFPCELLNSFMAVSDSPTRLFSPPQSSRSPTRPTCFTPCAPPPTTTLCYVSAGGAKGDTLASLPAWERNRRTAMPSEALPQRGPQFNRTVQEPPRLFQSWGGDRPELQSWWFKLGIFFLSLNMVPQTSL